MKIQNYNEFLKTDIVKDYKDEVINVIKNNYPDIDESKLNSIINKKIKEKVKDDPVIEFKNNYKNITKKLTLSKWYSWYKKKKPITTEHGVCYKRHEESTNLAAKLLEFILNTRKKHKKSMFDAKQKNDKISANFHNMRQKVYKIFANSFYGAMGQISCIFYNIFTALSVTGKGQSLITNAQMSFEIFFADNFTFNDINDMYTYISNIKNEKYTLELKTCLSKSVTKSELLERLMSKFEDEEYATKNRSKIVAIIKNLSKKDVNKIYYKNNFYEFAKNPKVFKKILKIMDKVESFNNPNEIPEEINDDLNELWLYFKEFVYYPHTVYNHMVKAKNMTRKTAITIDTDSNFLNLEPFLDFVTENSDKYDKNSINDNDLFKIINIATFILGKMIEEVHERYTAECNVPEEKRSIINMKNEFLIKRMLLTKSKKSYAGILLLQEGVPIKKEDSLDIKGLSIKKSNVNRNVSSEMQNILEEDILNSKEISLSKVLKRLSILEDKIQKSLDNCEVEFLRPDKSNEPESYKTPFQQMAVRGIYAWNVLYPDREITYPAQINLLKLKKIDLFNLQQNMDNTTFEDEKEKSRIHNAIEDILHNSNFENYGFSVLAIPKTDNKFPVWLLPFVDSETIIYDSMINFNKIIQSVGIKIINTSASEEHYSNIIDF